MLNLYKLEIFALVVRTGSFSAAAERLLMSQPAVSQHIQDLEASLGTRLFRRGRRGVSLTPAGETLYRYAQEILRLVAEAENAVADIRHLSGGQVTVAATPGIGVYLLPDWAQAFRRRYPNLTVAIQTRTTPQIMEGLLRGEMDIGLIEGELEELDNDEIGVLALEDVEQFVIVGPEHPWWGRSTVAMEELTGQRFVMRQRHSQTRIWLEEALRTAHVQVQVVAEFDNMESIKRAVAHGDDITILPHYVVRREVEAGTLAALAVEGRPLWRTLKLVWNRHAHLSPVTRAFLRSLEKHLPRLQELAMT